jgi:hypothetical protein
MLLGRAIEKTRSDETDKLSSSTSIYELDTILTAWRSLQLPFVQTWLVPLGRAAGKTRVDESDQYGSSFDLCS